MGKVEEAQNKNPHQELIKKEKQKLTVTLTVSLLCAFTRGISRAAEEHRRPLNSRHGPRVKAH